MRCRTFDQRWSIAGVAKEMIRTSNLGKWRGKGNSDYLNRCFAYHQPTGSKLGLTRDEGHHACGWWKNPDYERCRHLSLTFHDPETGQPTRDKDELLTQQWIDVIFGDNKRLIWSEPPFSDAGEALCTWHYRLFFHADWKTVLLPRKEVYSRAFTEAGWLPFSELQGRVKEETE